MLQRVQWRRLPLISGAEAEGAERDRSESEARSSAERTRAESGANAKAETEAAERARAWDKAKEKAYISRVAAKAR